MIVYFITRSHELGGGADEVPSERRIDEAVFRTGADNMQNEPCSAAISGHALLPRKQ
jgi:hypothetical protein